MWFVHPEHSGRSAYPVMAATNRKVSGIRANQKGMRLEEAVDRAIKEMSEDLRSVSS